MRKVLRNGFAVLRGAMRTVGLKAQRGGDVAIGKKLCAFRNTDIRVAKESRLSVGNGVRVGKDALISVLNGGELELGDGVSLGENNRIVCHEKISIGKDTILAPSVMIYDHDHTFDAQTGVHKREFKTSPVVIGANCWIGANTVILRGTTIGKNCVVGAGSVVKGDIPDSTIFVQKRTEQCIPMYTTAKTTDTPEQNKSSGGGVIPLP